MRYLLDLADMDRELLIAIQDDDELTGELRQLIEDAHYSGNGWQIRTIWLWLDGAVAEMELKLDKEERAGDDYLDWHYRVVRKDGEGEPVPFTVTIDGRS